jgi:hypothetical protein
LDLRFEETLREWNPEKHFLVTAMTFLKGIFYLKSFDHFPKVPNEEARKILDTDKELYLQKVEKCVQESLDRMYEPPEPGCLIVFTEPKPAHYNLRVKIFGVTAASAAAASSVELEVDEGGEETEGVTNTGGDNGKDNERNTNGSVFLTPIKGFSTPSRFFDATNEVII